MKRKNSLKSLLGSRKIVVVEDSGVPRYFFVAKNPYEVRLRILRSPERIPLGVVRELTQKERLSFFKQRKTKKTKRKNK